MRFDFHIHHHFGEEIIFVANPELTSALSSLQSTIEDKNSTIASLSTALDGNGDAVSSAVSSAVDAEDTEIAGSISAIIG